jgi:protein SCO1/2
VRSVALFAAALTVLLARQSLAYSSLAPADIAALEFRQHPGAALPLDAAFRDEDGATVRLGALFGRRPVVVILEYLHCATLCGFVLQDAARGLAAVPLVAGRDYEVAAISIDPRDGPADAQAARAQYLARFPGAGPGWHFLTGAAPEIARVADAVGFPFRHDDADGQYAHPAGITIATPEGKVARYLLGVDYRPLDLKLALTAASKGAIAAPASALLLLCFHYDPGTGRYSLAIADVLRGAALLTVAGIGAMMALLAYRHRRG